MNYFFPVGDKIQGYANVKAYREFAAENRPEGWNVWLTIGFSPAPSKKAEAQEPRVFINPEITWASKETSTHEEGCLSIPEYYEEVARPLQVKVKYLDLDGKAHEIEADGLFATCLQHEIDHTNGVLFIDHISKLKRDRVIKKFTKAAKTANKETKKKVEA